MTKSYENIDTLLTKIVSHPHLHLYWLETLSYLENRGAHKIIHYQPKGHVDLFLLQHAAEETRHAFFFKKQLCRLNQGRPLRLQFLGKTFAKRYLDLLDLSISRLLRKEAGLCYQDLKRGSYYLTSYIIEVRANDLFERYEKTLRAKGCNFSLRGILKEEAVHLKEMESLVDSDKLLSKYKGASLTLENKLYLRLLTALTHDVQKAE